MVIEYSKTVISNEFIEIIVKEISKKKTQMIIGKNKKNFVFQKKKKKVVLIMFYIFYLIISEGQPIDYVIHST